MNSDTHKGAGFDTLEWTVTARKLQFLTRPVDQGIRAGYQESVKVTHESSNSSEKLGLHGLLFGEAAAN